MVLTTEQKLFLTTNKEKIRQNFNLSVSLTKKYLGVYVTVLNTVFITFKETLSFQDVVVVGKHSVTKVCIFDRTADFDTQFDAYVSPEFNPLIL